MENAWMARFEHSRIVEVNCFYQVIIYVEISLSQMVSEILLSTKTELAKDKVNTE